MSSSGGFRSGPASCNGGRQNLETTFPTATAAVKLLEEQGILTELIGQKKNRCFRRAASVEAWTRDAFTERGNL